MRSGEIMVWSGCYQVALTGYGMPADRDRSLGAGFDQHLTKPVELETLAKALDLARL